MKRILYDFLETSYTKKYWPEQHDWYFKWKLGKILSNDEIDFETWFKKIWDIDIIKNNADFFTVHSWILVSNVMVVISSINTSFWLQVSAIKR